MKKLYMRSLIALFFSGFYIQVNADDVIVKSNQSNLSQYFDNCNNIRIGCAADLYSTLNIINSTKFQNKLDFNQSKQFEIKFLPKIYRLKNTINLNWNSNVKLIFQGNTNKNSKTIVSGAIEANLLPLNEKDSNFLRFPASIRKNIYVVKLPIFEHINVTGSNYSIAPTSGEIFWNNDIATLARWPNKDFSSIINVNSKFKSFNLYGFNRKIDDSQLQAHAFWYSDWSDQTYPILQDRNNTNNFTLSINFSAHYNIKAHQRIYLENSLELLDSPGEWYQDYKTGIVYFWLPDKKKKVIEFSSLKNLITLNNSKNIKISDMIFEKTRANAILINNSNFVDIDGVLVRYVGNIGVKINNGSNNVINNSKILNTGDGGVYIKGGDRYSLVSSHNVIQNSYFNNNDRLVYSYRPSIYLVGVGQIVRNNTIENNNHSAIIFTGNNHMIYNNKISNVLKLTSDAGVIYTGRDFTSQGTIIENNIISNIIPFRENGSVIGVYLDDQASGIRVENNKFFDNQYGLFLGGGRNNIIKNNVFIKNKISIRYDARGVTWQKIDPNNEKNPIIRKLKNLPIKSTIWKKEYPDLANILNNDFGHPKYNVIKGNKFIQSGAIRFESGLSDNSSDKGATISSNTQTQ